MASIPFSTSSVDALKKKVRFIYDERKSSHLSEALAFALGFKSHAALLAAAEKSGPDPLYRLLNENKFHQRMQELGYPDDPEFLFEDAKTPDMLNTECAHAYKYKFTKKRDVAWRNLVVCAVNEALERRLFSLRPADNRWPGAEGHGDSTYLFDFQLPCNLPARVAIHDAGFDEISIQVAVNPKGDRVSSFNPGFAAGDAFAFTWLERRNGAWIQSDEEPDLRCRRNLESVLATMQVEPLGYGDRGRVMM